MVGSIKMSRNRLVNIICSLWNEGVQQICQIDVGRFTDVKFAIFNARNAVNDVGGGACKIVTPL